MAAKAASLVGAVLLVWQLQSMSPATELPPTVTPGDSGTVGGVGATPFPVTQPDGVARDRQRPALDTATPDGAADLTSPDGAGWPTLILVMGLAEAPTAQQGKSLTETDTNFWKAGIAKMEQRCALFFWSLFQMSGKDVEMRVYVVGNKRGFDMMQMAIAVQGFNRVVLVHCNLTDAMLKDWTEPLTKIGLTRSYVHRLWDFGKFWIERVVPDTVESGMVLDMDIVFRVSVQELWAKFQLLRDGEEKWMMGARPEPGENLGSITPWLIEHEKEKFANTGVILMNLDRMRAGKFTEVLIRSALKSWDAHPFWKKSSHSAWPPEQWALNVIWGMNKWAYLPLDDPWQANCVDKEGPWPGQVGSNKAAFLARRKEAYLLHFCNNMIVQMLPKKACEKLGLHESSVAKCNDF